MIKNLYVIQETGQWFYQLKLLEFDILNENENVSQTTDDVNLISRFFIAILTFTNMIEKDNGVNKLRLKKSIYYFIKKGETQYIFDTSSLGSKLLKQDFYSLLKNVENLVKNYMKDHEINNYYIQIGEDEILSDLIKNVIAQFIHSYQNKRKILKNHLGITQIIKNSYCH